MMMISRLILLCVVSMMMMMMMIMMLLLLLMMICVVQALSPAIFREVVEPVLSGSAAVNYYNPHAVAPSPAAKRQPRKKLTRIRDLQTEGAEAEEGEAPADHAEVRRAYEGRSVAQPGREYWYLVSYVGA
jgi:Na+-transporting methylmalonyl-CoA/oxaloacetate decarboxylase gamma subunit